jgi:hypothetical protein
MDKDRVLCEVETEVLYIRQVNSVFNKVVPWLMQLVTCLLSWRPGSVHVDFVVDKVTLGQVSVRVFRFYPVNFIPPLLHYTKNGGRGEIIFITGLRNKSRGSCASVAPAAGPFTIKKKNHKYMNEHITTSEADLALAAIWEILSVM